MNLSVVEKNKKFVVVQDGKPIQLPKTDGAAIITEFDTKADAERYMCILANLKKRKYA